MDEISTEPNWQEMYLELGKQVVALQEEAQESKEKWVRVCAEFDNFQKRVKRDKETWKMDSIQSLLRDFMSINDSVDLLLQNSKLDSLDESLREGLRLIAQNCSKFLESNGVEKVSPLVGDPFDPNTQRAVSVFESKEVAPNSVLMLVRAGYKSEQQVFRPADVVVSKEVANKDA